MSDWELNKALEDAVLYGTGVMKDGKHIPIEDVYLDPRDATIEAQAAEIERLTKASDGDVGLMHWQGEKIERLEAEIERLRGKLREIEAMCPVTCDMSVAHAMADVATEALAGKAEQ